VISASSIHDNDDGTAWMIHDDAPGAAPIYWRRLDRPCEWCQGEGSIGESFPGGERLHFVDCDDCGATGRHTFTIDVETGTDERAPWYRTLLVHVVQVLPIVRWDDQRAIASYDAFIVTGSPTDPEWLRGYQRGTDIGRKMFRPSLPPDAVPGMWAVPLRVHKEDT
jgi:hypothetical protein